MHPLEALYKRTAQPGGEATGAAPEAQGFSFFADGGEDGVEDGDADAGDTSGIQVPLTPFTRQDLELRGIRSAAPTPDTALPNRKFTPWERGDESEEGDGDDPEQGGFEKDEQTLDHGAAAPGAEHEDKPLSDFQKWFWENRGDLNRSWKKRRKLAGKEKRYRENKARMARSI